MDQILHKKSLFSTAEVSDFVIIIGDQRLNVHKSVLMSSSEYFSALFNSEMIETKNKEIILKETLIKPFLIVLKLSYNIGLTEEEWLELKIQEFCESIVTANKYQFIESEKQLSKKLIDIFEYKLSESGDQLTTDNTTVWEVLEMAKLHNLMILFELCLNFFDENINYAFNTFDYQFVSADILLDVVRRDTFGASEMKIFKLVNKWIQKHKIVSNKKCIEEEMLLESVRLNLISFQDLKTVIESGLYEPEVIEAKAKNELNGDLAINKRICYETGKVFRNIDCKNELHLKNEQMVVICVNCVLRMPSKINHLMFNIQPIDPFVKFYANYWIGIADSQAENGFRKILDYNHDCCCLGEQDLYFAEPFVAESIRIVVECYIEAPEPTIDVEDMVAEAGPAHQQQEQQLLQADAAIILPLRRVRDRARVRSRLSSVQQYYAAIDPRDDLIEVDGLPSTGFAQPQLRQPPQPRPSFPADPNWRRRSLLHRRLHGSHLNSKVISIGSVEHEYTKTPLKTINSCIVPEVNVCHKKGVQCYSPYFGDKFTAFLGEEVLNNSYGKIFDVSEDWFSRSLTQFDEYVSYDMWEKVPKRLKESFESNFQQLIQRPISISDQTNHYMIRLSQPIFADSLQFELILENQKSKHSDECLAAECKVELCSSYSRDMSSAEWTVVSNDSYLTQSGFCNLEFDIQKVSVIRISGFRYNSDKSLIYALHLKNFSIPADRQSWSWTSGAKLGNETTAEVSN